ncbi:MAG: EpsI family protein [Phycisphaerae bacterium]
MPWVLLAIGLVAAYAYNFSEMWRRWFPAWHREGLGLYDRLMEGESYYTHAPLVPLVSLIMAILLIRHTRIPVQRRPVLGGAVLGAGLLFHLFASLARVNFASGFSIIAVVAGLVLMLWGATALRRLWFPIAFLFFMVPLPQVSIYQLNFRLKMLASELGVAAANVLGVAAEQNSNTVLLLGGKSLTIANVCGGLRTLISLIAFGALYAYVCKLRGGWRLGLFAMSVPVAVAANAIRIVTLIVVADVWDTDVATGFFHDFSGLMVYGLAFGMMFGLEHLVLSVRKGIGFPATIAPLFDGIQRGADDEDQWPRMLRAAASPAGWTAAVVVLAAAAGANWLNRSVPPVWTGEVAASAVPKTLTVAGRQLRGHDRPVPQSVMDILETKDILLRQYLGTGGPPVSFQLVFSEDNRKGTHPPDVCLEGGGWDIVAKAPVAVHDVDGRGTVPCREIIVQKGAERAYHLYTYCCGDTYTPSFWEQQLRILLNGLLRRNASGALIEVSMPVQGNLEEARRGSKRFMAAVVPYLDRNLP